ncbi:DUF6318 family protein [Intrasporangium sp. YIM S08009]|uniref:DUF6318 family protein n=1 Tax=Intrasporangium zincisolvens TaxID=3080018 RepID=UPI002B058D86|nr:DUF6318 family protein [Intrasporangium sp. YIM S08009]
MTWAAAGLALAVTALAACSGGDPAPPQTSAASATVPSTTASTTTSTPSTTSTTSAGPAFPAGLPDAAKTKDKAGAEAFVKHFVATVNVAWVRPDPERIEALCSKSSKACASFVADAQEMRTKNQHYVGPAIQPAKVSALGSNPEDQRVETWLGVLGTKVVDAKNNVVYREEPKTLKTMIHLAWGSAGWSVSAVKGL